MLSVLLRRVCRIRGNGEVIKREEFDQRKAAAEAARLARLQRKPQKLASQGKHVGDCPLLQVKTTDVHVNVQLPVLAAPHSQKRLQSSRHQQR